MSEIERHPQFQKTNFDRVYTATTLPKPMSPASWIKEVMYKKITRISMTCGGGLGGSHWFEYVERIPLEKLAADGSPLLIVRSWDSKEFLLNKSYMVKADELTIASAVLRSTNPYFPIGDYTYYYLVEDGHRLTLLDECRPAV